MTEELSKRECIIHNARSITELSVTLVVNIARPVESRPTEKFDFRSVHYNRSVCPLPISLRKVSAPN